MCVRPILIVEGFGDASAVPLLIRRIASANGIPQFQTASRPKINQTLPKLLRPGEVEKFVEYTRRDSDGDSVLFALDCDDTPIEAAHATIRARILNIAQRKPIAIVLFQREFESIFLYSLQEIIVAYPDFRWTSVGPPPNPEGIRDVKGLISAMMPKDKAYRERRDQPRFASVVDLQKLQQSRSFCRLQAAILWLAGQNADACGVFP